MKKVTGHQLKEALKMASLTLSTIFSQFDETLYKFHDEEKESPSVIADKISEFENKVAKIQTAQSLYNLSVKIIVNNKEMTLEEAIKRVGGAGRMAKMWRNASKGSKHERYYGGDHKRRSADEEIAKPTISKTDALEKAKDAEKFAAKLRTAIAIGNSTEVSIDFVDDDLLS